MTRRFTFRREAEADIDKTFDWYKAELPAWAVLFWMRSMPRWRVLKRPFSYQVKYKNARRAILHRFPYHVTYVVRDEDIVIVACMHERRDPTVWQARL